MGVIYPIFFVGCAVIAMALYYIYSKNAPHGVQQLVVTPDYAPVLDLIPNVTQRLNAQAAGSFTPNGAAM